MEKVQRKKFGRKYSVFDTSLAESSETDSDFRIFTCPQQEVPSDIRAFYGHPLTAATHDANGETLALLHEYRSLPIIDACQDHNLQAVACMLASERNDGTSLDMPLRLDTKATTSEILHLPASSASENHLTEILKSQGTQQQQTDDVKTTNLPMDLESTNNYHDASGLLSQRVQNTDFNGDHCVDSKTECRTGLAKHSSHKRPSDISELKRVHRKSKKLSNDRQEGLQHRCSKKSLSEQSCARMVPDEWTRSSENVLTGDVKCLEWLESAGLSEPSYCVQNISRTTPTSMASGSASSHVSQPITLPEMRHSQPVRSSLPSSVSSFTTNETYSKHLYSVASEAEDKKTTVTENRQTSSLPFIRTYMNHDTIFPQNVAGSFAEQSQIQSVISDDVLRRQAFFNKHYSPSDNCFHRDIVNTGTYSGSFSNVDMSSVQRDQYSDIRFLHMAAQQYPADFPPFCLAEHTAGNGHCDNYAVSSSLNLSPSNILQPTMGSRETEHSLKQYSATNMPQMNFPLPPVPPGYRLVITHHQLPTPCDSTGSASSVTSPQVTRLIIDHPSSALTTDHGNA